MSALSPMTISRAAAAAGVGVETIRFYERKRLIEQPERHNGSYRVYPRATVERIRAIQRTQALGFSLSRLSDSGGSAALGVLFGLTLSAPLVLAVAWAPARRGLDWLGGLSVRIPRWTGTVLVALGLWSIGFGALARLGIAH